jgi:hypothetical protein
MFTGNTSIPFNLIALTANAVPGASPQGIAYLTLTVSGSLTAYAVAPGGG